MSTLDKEALERLSKVDKNALANLSALNKEALEKLSKVDKDSLSKLSTLDKEALERLSKVDKDKSLNLLPNQKKMSEQLSEVPSIALTKDKKAIKQEKMELKEQNDLLAQKLQKLNQYNDSQITTVNLQQTISEQSTADSSDPIEAQEQKLAQLDKMIKQPAQQKSLIPKKEQQKQIQIKKPFTVDSIKDHAQKIQIVDSKQKFKAFNTSSFLSKVKCNK